MEAIKAILLRVPYGTVLLRKFRAIRFYRRVGGLRTTKEIFSHIYEKNRWGSGESVSGGGSTIEYTENIRREIPKLIKTLGVRRVLDAPCGDYHWFRLIPRENGFTYVGGDIVAPLVQRNQEAFGSADTQFVELDITKDALPAADLWLCRDALFHLSFEDVFLALDNFLGSDAKYLLTSSHTDCERNSDIPTGSFRQLNLVLPPFALCPPTMRIDDWIEGHPVRRLCLWEKPAIHNSLASNKTFSRVAKRR